MKQLVGDHRFTFDPGQAEEHPDLMGDAHALIIAEVKMAQCEARRGAPGMGGKAAGMGEDDLDIFGDVPKTGLFQEHQHLTATAIGRDAVSDRRFFAKPADQSAVGILVGASR